MVCFNVPLAVFGDRIFPLNVTLDFPDDRESFHPILRIRLEFPFELVNSSLPPTPSIHDDWSSSATTGGSGYSPPSQDSASSHTEKISKFSHVGGNDTSLPPSSSTRTTQHLRWNHVDDRDIFHGIENRQERCMTEAYISLTLPDSVFVDPDELGDKFYASSVSQTDGSARGKGKVRDWRVRPAKVDIERPERVFRSDEAQKVERHTLWLRVDGGGGSAAQTQSRSSWRNDALSTSYSSSSSLTSSATTTTHDGSTSGSSLTHTKNVPLSHSGGVALASSSTVASGRKRSDRPGVYEGEKKEMLVWQVDVPLHGRYLNPSHSTYTDDAQGSVHGLARRRIVLPEGEGDLRAGWKCAQGHSEWPELSTIPIVDPSYRGSTTTISLPTGLRSHQALVESVTPLVIWLGWIWIVWKLFRLRWRVRQQQEEGGSVAGEKEVQVGSKANVSKRELS